MTTSCAEASLGAGEELAGTATHAARWLLLEWRGAWGRDAIAESGLPAGARRVLESFDGRSVLIRRPDRRAGTSVFVVEGSEGHEELRRIELDDAAELESADLATGEIVDGPLLLVCAHGRRDACCARLGAPLFSALAGELEPGRVWQASHLGGHRFAPNVVVLPWGVQLGRIPFERADEVAKAIRAGTIPLDLYRGRTSYAQRVQAGEAAVRRAYRLDRVGDVRLADDRDPIRFATPRGELSVRVDEMQGPLVPASCGEEPSAQRRFVTSVG